jgi:hypothetical protein
MRNGQTAWCAPVPRTGYRGSAPSRGNIARPPRAGQPGVKRSLQRGARARTGWKGGSPRRCASAKSRRAEATTHSEAPMASHRAPGLVAGNSSSFFDTLLSLHLTWQKSCVIILASLNWTVSYVRADLSRWASEWEAHVYRVRLSPPQTMLPVQPSPLAVHPLK